MKTEKMNTQTFHGNTNRILRESSPLPPVERVGGETDSHELKIMNSYNPSPVNRGHKKVEK
jgi:hypothetical protein